MPIPASLLVLLFILAEIATFVLVGQAIGVAGTLALVVLAVAAGVVVLRRQSVATVMRVRSELAAGRTPGGPVLDGALAGAGALLLILPGFLTDLAALALLIPATRRAIRLRLARRFSRSSPGRPQRGARVVVELHRGEYLSHPQAESPWRPPPGGAGPAAGE